MKTTSRTNRAITMATVIFTAILFGTSAPAQTNLNLYRNGEIQASYDRLEAFMSSVELAVKYTAPSVEYDEIQNAMIRLDFLARKTENEIQYKVPDEAEIQLVEYAVQGKDQESENTQVIALKRVTPKLIGETKD